MKHLIFALMLTLCCALPASAAEKKELNLVYVEWDCATASTYLAKAILEEKMGYKVNLLPLSQPLIWPSLVSGAADATLSVWLPESSKYEYARYKDQTELSGVLLRNGARIGLVVPDYVPLKSIEELRDNADKFNKTIIGIEPGSTAVTLTEKEVIPQYNLPMEILDGSSATMTATLGDAIRRKEWVVVTGWSPHWKFGRWKLHFLDDPKNIYGKDETIYIVVRLDFKERFPDAWLFLKRMHYTGLAQFQTYMNWNQEPGATPESSAKRFMKEYPELVADWLKK